jgi:hypothetical protein
MTWVDFDHRGSEILKTTQVSAEPSAVTSKEISIPTINNPTFGPARDGSPYSISYSGNSDSEQRCSSER